MGTTSAPIKDLKIRVMNNKTTLRGLCLVLLFLSSQVLAATNISPFSRHEERYQQLFSYLVSQGMAPERVEAIFSSKKARRIDRAAIDRAYKRATGVAILKTKKQLNAIAVQLSKHINNHSKTYALLETRFEVNKEIVAAILFKETHLGQFSNWKHESFTVFNSLLGFLEFPNNANDRQRKRIERIVTTAQNSLAGLILYCEKNNIDITRTTFPASFAGAIGIPQFMPMYMNYATTRQNSLGNLDKMSDAILSVGNLLTNKFAWPGLIDFNQLKSIDDVFRRYIQYDQKLKTQVSACLLILMDIRYNVLLILSRIVIILATIVKN